MIQKSDLEKLERFIRGLSDSSEERYIWSLFSDNENNPVFQNQIKKDFNQYFKNHPEVDYNLINLLDRIHHTIHEKEYRDKQKVLRKLYRWYSRAAAVLIIPLLLLGSYWFFEQREEQGITGEEVVGSTIHAPLGSRIKFSLPDGTHGWLNSGSSLEYHLPFKANRQIKLTGEAWFEVSKDELHPFSIIAFNSTIKVLGTKFNLNAYPEDQYVEVVLDEGKVNFSVDGVEQSVELNPKERLVFRQGKVMIDPTDPSKYSAWIDGKLVFRGDPMPEVARRIERWYNVEVELIDKDLEKDVIRGIFMDDSLEEVLHYLSMTSPIKYRVIDRNIGKDGTYQKKKVLLYRKNVKNNY